jgi:hypothetical protein
MHFLILAFLSFMGIPLPCYSHPICFRRCLSTNSSTKSRELTCTAGNLACVPVIMLHKVSSYVTLGDLVSYCCLGLSNTAVMDDSGRERVVSVQPGLASSARHRETMITEEHLLTHFLLALRAKYLTAKLRWRRARHCIGLVKRRRKRIAYALSLDARASRPQLSICGLRTLSCGAGTGACARC